MKDLRKKLVLLAGPRQAGKTTLAKDIASEIPSSVYLNYDRSSDRNIIHEESWLPACKLLILDEIHKMPHWKNFLKGIYDTKPEDQMILVTGSARLEIFNEVGDSLAGRYFLHRLLPLSPAELAKMGKKSTISRFMERGSFPEPYLTEHSVDAKRWRLQYVDSLLRTDVLDFEEIHNVKAIRLVFELLRGRVGSPISYSSIAQDVAISPHTVKKYIHILEALYIVFRVNPFSKNIARSLLKEPKIYFFDTGLVRGSDGVKFENLVAISLLKHVFHRIDYFAESYALHYLRTKEGHEVDFALVIDDQMEQIIEVKNTHHGLGKGIQYFAKKYNTPATQVLREIDREHTENRIELRDGLRFLESLSL